MKNVPRRFNCVNYKTFFKGSPFCQQNVLSDRKNKGLKISNYLCMLMILFNLNPDSSLSLTLQFDGGRSQQQKKASELVFKTTLNTSMMLDEYLNNVIVYLIIDFQINFVWFP